MFFFNPIIGLQIYWPGPPVGLPVASLKSKHLTPRYGEIPKQAKPTKNQAKTRKTKENQQKPSENQEKSPAPKKMLNPFKNQ